MRKRRAAWSALKSGRTSRKLKKTAMDKVDYSLLWLIGSLAIFFNSTWEWALPAAILAVINGVQGVGAFRLAAEVEMLENMMRKLSIG